MFRKKHKPVLSNYMESEYGRIYYPLYNPSVMPHSTEHAIYNADGTPMRTFFIRDIHCAHNPMFESKYFIWDRFNIGLNTHFYSHNAMLETMGHPDKKYGYLIESEAIVPNDYKIFDRNPELSKEFDAIFTYSADILNKIPNAKFVPMCASLHGGSIAPENQWQKKTKNVSILSSNKNSCDLHKFRLHVAQQCKLNGWAETFGTFDGGPRIDDICDAYRDFRFFICIENDIQPYYFSERLICAFANQTIPIYLGATEIDKFFNPDGIIKLSVDSDIEHILKQCTIDEYLCRLPAILDNYKRAFEYLNPWDYMYTHYLMNQ